MTYVDAESGEEFQVVGAPLPLAPSPSNLPYAVENLRLCGCSLEQLVQKQAEGQQKQIQPEGRAWKAPPVG